MIDPSELQSFLLNLEGGTLPVDLVKIGKSHNQKPLGEFVGVIETILY